MSHVTCHRHRRGIPPSCGVGLRPVGRISAPLEPRRATVSERRDSRGRVDASSTAFMLSGKGRRGRAAGALAGAAILIATLADAQTVPPAATPGLNPTQEIAKETPEGPAIVAGPTEIRIGGYLGVTGIYRSTNGGGGTATGFATIPFSDTVDGQLSEARLSAQPSRLSIRVNGVSVNARLAPAAATALLGQIAYGPGLGRYM